MKFYEIDQIEEKIDELERHIIRSGLPKKYLMDIKSIRNTFPLLRKEAQKNER